VKKLKAVTIVFFSILLALFFTGCTQTAEKPAMEEGEKPLVIATLFPQYDFVKQIAGDKVSVNLLLPPGVEPHSYEPSPRDIADIQKADLFIYTGAYMEPWAERIIDAAEDTALLIVDTSIGIDLMDEDDHHHHDQDDHHHEEDHHNEEDDHHHEEDHHHHEEDDDDRDHDHHHDGGYDHGGKDPHFWLDPLLAKVMVDHIIEGLVQVDPENTSYYRQNGEAYKQQLQDLHDKISSSLAGLENRTILYAGHFAFGYFADRYDLDHVSPYEGFAPDAEPTPGNIADLIKRVDESNAKVIYYEELIEPKVAKVVAEQTGAEMVLLHGAHNVTTDELNSGVTYIQIMEDNLAKLLEGLQ
jgi:zinc transport system substrate-binding protein